MSPDHSCRSTLPGSSTRSCARNADAELLHARLQRGPVHAQEGCGSVGASNLPHCSLESSNDFQPFSFLESRAQIPVALTSRDAVLQTFPTFQNDRRRPIEMPPRVPVLAEAHSGQLVSSSSPFRTPHPLQERFLSSKHPLVNSSSRLRPDVYLAGIRSGTPLSITKKTSSFAGFVLPALRPTTCTSCGPS
jgi:hypothetical protein